MNDQLEAIGEDFYLSLNDLTFNSRPIISSLTVIAQENVNAASYISKAVIKRIEKAPPSQKLFSFYLLDSISKNVGSPYTLLFSDKLFQLFTQSFLIVDNATREKFISLFKTWKFAKSSSGLPLFNEEPIHKIEQFLIKASSIYKSSLPPSQQMPQMHMPPPQQQQQLPQMPPVPQINIQELLSTVDNLLYLTNQRLMLNPLDNSISAKIQLISQLKYAITSENLPLNALVSVKNQLNDMLVFEKSQLNNLPKPVNPNLSLNSQSLKSLLPGNNGNNINNNTNTTTNNNNTNNNNTNVLSNLLNLRTNGELKLNSNNFTSNLTKPIQPSNNLNDLINNLQKTGLVRNNTNNINNNSSSVLKSLLLNSNLNSITNKNNNDNDNNSNNKLIQQDNDLNEFAINNKNLIKLNSDNLYVKFFINLKPNKCGTCGKRFSNDIKGQNNRRLHLDWHFRINKKLKDGNINQSRSWYLDDEEFVRFKDEELFGEDELTNNTTGNSKNGNNSNNNDKKEQKYVIIPENSTEMTTNCSICKEIIKSEYNDDLGEWIWNNAVKVNNKIYHLSCYEESNNNNSNSSSRNTNTSSSNNISLSNLIGLKRKRESDDEGQEEEESKKKQSIDLNLLKSIISKTTVNQA